MPTSTIATAPGYRLELHDRGTLLSERARQRLDTLMREEARERRQLTEQASRDDLYRQWMIYGPVERVKDIPMADHIRLLQDPWMQKRLARERDRVDVVVITSALPRWAQWVLRRRGWIRSVRLYPRNFAQLGLTRVTDITELLEGA